MNATPDRTLPLAERGTTGLLQYCHTGSTRLFEARLSRAKAIILSRYGKEASEIFRTVAFREKGERLEKFTAAVATLADPGSLGFNAAQHRLWSHFHKTGYINFSS